MGWSTGALALLVLAVQGCVGATGPATDPSGDTSPDTAPPSILELTLNPINGNPLAAVLTFRTDEPATWTLTVDEPASGRSWTVAPDLASATTHLVPVLGLRASRYYQLVLEVTDGSGNTALDGSLTWQTDALPDDIPLLTVLDSRPEDMTASVTLVNLIRWGEDVLNRGLLLAVDEEGDVVWIHRAAETLVEARRTPDGTLIVAFGESGGVREIDMLGNVLHEWRPADLGLDSLHHAVSPGPGDNIISLATELRLIDGYALEDGTTTGYSVVGDLVVELPREGLPIHSWSLLDVLDPYHYNPGFFVPFWLLLYPDAPGGPKDWSHGNAVQYDDHDDSYMVSLANQDLLVKLDRDSGARLWSLGEAGDVLLDAGGTWFSVPHGAEWLPGGRVLLYDDGVFKSEKRSRIVEYALSPPQNGGPWCAKETWSWNGGDAPFYCMGPADVDYLPDGNLLVLHGSLVEHPEASPFGTGNHLWVRLEEIRREPAGERVFGLDIGGPMDPTGEKITAFAAERLPSLYPPGWKVQQREAPDLSCEQICAGSECGWVKGCVCGLCTFGTFCLDGLCLDCAVACADMGRECGLLDMSCDCGTCLDGFMCNEQGSCQDEVTFCAPFCEGRECGVVGAFYLGQSCNCGDCPEGTTCDNETASCK